MRIQLAKTTRQFPVGKKVQWHGVLVFEKFPEGIMICEYMYAQVRVLTLQCDGNSQWWDQQPNRI